MKTSIDAILKGDRKTIAKLITLVENNSQDAAKILDALTPYTGNAHIIGFTGPPGCGKSTLIDKLTKELRKRRKTVAIIAVDPTSPFTGGAILGDRIRMQELSTDKGIFIRSMATRGAFGGIADATENVAKILDASGKDIIFIETVGAGQSEVEIMNVVHTCVVIFSPGLGDDIQAIKAGLMEIADVFVVNKADLNGADKAAYTLNEFLAYTHGTTWVPPVLKTIAIENKGIYELIDAIKAHGNYLKSENLFSKKKRARLSAHLREFVSRRWKTIFDEIKNTDEYNALMKQIEDKLIDIHSAADQVLFLIVKRLISTFEQDKEVDEFV